MDFVALPPLFEVEDFVEQEKNSKIEIRLVSMCTYLKYSFIP